MKLIALGIHYVKNGKVPESLFYTVNTTTFNAPFLTELKLEVFGESSLDPPKLLDKYYDGSSVMKLINGGMEALI